MIAFTKEDLKRFQAESLDQKFQMLYGTRKSIAARTIMPV